MHPDAEPHRRAVRIVNLARLAQHLQSAPRELREIAAVRHHHVLVADRLDLLAGAADAMRAVTFRGVARALT